MRVSDELAQYIPTDKLVSDMECDLARDLLDARVQIAEQARELSLCREWRDAVQGIAVDAGVVITGDPIEDVRLAIEFRDTAIAEQERDHFERKIALETTIENQADALELERSQVEIERTAREKAERERDGARDLVHEWATKHGELNAQLDEARKALVWVWDNSYSYGFPTMPDEVMAQFDAANAAVCAAWEVRG